MMLMLILFIAVQRGHNKLLIHIWKVVPLNSYVPHCLFKFLWMENEQQYIQVFGREYKK
jgi:hypothetical protein